MTDPKVITCTDAMPALSLNACCPCLWIIKVCGWQVEEIFQGLLQIAGIEDDVINNGLNQLWTFLRLI